MIRAIVLSGGSGLVGLALLEEFAASGVPVAVISIGSSRLLEGCLPDMLYEELDWRSDDVEGVAARFVDIVRKWRGADDLPWPIYPTEDGGLGFLEARREAFSDLVTLCGLSRRGVGCADKAALATALSGSAVVEPYLPPTLVARTVDEALAACRTIGSACVIKPATKPRSMRLTGMRGKAIFSAEYANGVELTGCLESVWTLSPRWLVQGMVGDGDAHEVSVWAVRFSDGSFDGVCARQRWKHPSRGGTSSHVAIEPRMMSLLLPVARTVLREIDYVGLCELEFIVEETSEGARPWLIEINARPWLQYGLAHRAGLPAASDTFRMLTEPGWTAERHERGSEELHWVNPERLVLAALSGTQGNVLRALLRAIGMTVTANYVTVYGSRIEGVRKRWITHRLGRIARPRT